tara:strand:+ start:30178 stop:32565 length:2388 start_codon:yes stop_codon:yes gene_type:complete
MFKTWLLLLLCPLGLIAQNNYTISGYIRDAADGEELIGVNISIPELKIGTSTNVYGFYSLEVPSRDLEIQFQYIGYQTYTQNINLSANFRLDIELQSSSTQLNEVEITGEKADKNISDVQMSVTKLDVKEIQKVPQLLGETDVIRTLTLLPGISSVGEGASGFNVRGGASDQNLILLDEAPVYNSSHLFGFFSIFNADAIKDVQLFKGGIPAQYGGRLSSVVDVRQKEGNSKKLAANGGLGLLSSRLLVESPIVKDKASFMVAARRSYLDVFLGLSPDETVSENILYFYDLNAKVNWRLGKKDRLFLSGYFGRDVFGVQNLVGFDWGNATSTLRWNHIYNEKLFSNLTLIYSDYNYAIGTPEGDTSSSSFKLTSRIRDYHLKNSYNYYLNSSNKIDFGVEIIAYEFNPGSIETSFRPTPIELQAEYALEPNLYISHEYKHNDRLTILYGLRYSSFYSLGKLNSRNYQNEDFPNELEVIDTTVFDSGDLVKGFDGFQGLEPRIGINYIIDEFSSVKASFNRTRQYIHLISNTTSPTPVDVYRSAGRYIDPATVYQYAMGYFRNFKDNQYEASIEVYYKDFIDLVDYRPAADLIFTEFIETELLTGIGRAYGAEFLLRKRTGKLTGWIGYTLARTERKVTGPTRDLSINDGEWYSANYDRVHDLSIVSNYSLTKKWDIGAIFAYQTGRPYTPPSAKFEYQGITAPLYEDRNSQRIPHYHRLDLSATYTPESKPGRKYHSSWNFGVYNVYARKNAYSIFFQSTPQEEGQTSSSTSDTQAVRLSIFATAIPFVTWNFNF